MRYQLLLWLFSAFFVSSITLSQDETSTEEVEASDTPKVLDVIKNSTNIDQPFRLRDPFKIPVKKKVKSKNIGGKKLGKEVDLKSINLDTIKVVGILVGEKRRAFVKSEKDVIILKEGDKLGAEEITLKAILPGGIVFVESIVNVYGQVEYIETIIPISEDGKK